jgi:hypothetical protein
MSSGIGLLRCACPDDRLVRIEAASGARDAWVARLVVELVSA